MLLLSEPLFLHLENGGGKPTRKGWSHAWGIRALSKAGCGEGAE